MADRPIKVERATDYLGNYVAYTYADGHVETDPPGRPQFKEDAQRNRKIEVARERATAILAAERSKFGTGEIPLPGNILRENANIVSGQLLIRPYLDQLRKLQNVAETSSAPRGQALNLINTVPIGGKVVGDNAGLQPEFNEDTLTLPVELAPSLPIVVYPTEV